MLERAGFLAPYGRSQRSRKMLRQKALGRRREASALWAVAAKGGKATRRCAGRKRVPSGHLPPKVAKRPEGVSKYKGCARPARRTPIFARKRNERRARPAPSATIERAKTEAVSRREASALWAVAAKGGKATRRCAGRKRVPSGHLPPKVAKRPEGVSKYKGCARPARRTPIFARKRNERRARPAPSATIERAKTEAVSRREASALWAVAAKGGKATRRRTGRKRVPSGHLPPKVAKRPEGVSKYKGCARPARRTPIFARKRNERRARPAPSATIERAKTEAVCRREAQMIEQPGRPLRPTLCQRPDPRQTVYSRRHSI